MTQDLAMKLTFTGLGVYVLWLLAMGVLCQFDPTFATTGIVVSTCAVVVACVVGFVGWLWTAK